MKIGFRMKLGLLTLLMIPVGSKATEGGWTSGGGDGLAMEFVSIGYRVHDMLEVIEKMRRPDPLKGLVDIAALKSKLESAKIESTFERLFVDHAEVDVINYPDQNRIVINRERWAAQSSIDIKAGIVLHEYLGLMHLDARYEISSKVAERIKRDPLANLEDYAMSCRAEAVHWKYGTLSFDIFNIGEHYAWARISASLFTFSPDHLKEHKVLREKGNGGDEFSFAGAKGTLFVELSYADLFEGESNFFIMILLNDNDDDNDNGNAEVFESQLTCQKLSL